MQSGTFFAKSNFEFGERVREINLPDSSKQSNIGHSIRITNKGETPLTIRTSKKKWYLKSKASASLIYDGSAWVKNEVLACPPEESSSSSSSSSCDEPCEPECRLRGPPGRDGCPGANGLNGLNGKNGKCDCQHYEFVRVLYSGDAAQYNVTVPVPIWARTASVTSVGGGAAGGLASVIEDEVTAGVGGGSGFSIVQVLPVSSGGVLSLSIGQGGRSLTPNGKSTRVTYLSPQPLVVYAPGGSSSGSGEYGGGGADGNPFPSAPGSGFEPGQPAVPRTSGGSGGGILPGQGGLSLVAESIYGAGGGGSAPGPIAASGGNGGGVGQLNGTSGSYGSGGGGAGVQTTGLSPVFGAPGNGGDGYVDVTFFY